MAKPASRTRPARGFTLIELMVVVAIIGLLAAIAVPSFVKYITNAKTSEARLHLEKIYNAARIYWLETFGANNALGPIPHQFPASVASTPAVTCCASGGRCPANVTLWTSPSWVALHFSMDDPHYYRYEFVASGLGGSARFTARANGDLDCDTVESTYEMYGSVSSGGDITGSGRSARINRLE
jgi:type IV pilus assembly protein PilA